MRPGSAATGTAPERPARRRRPASPPAAERRARTAAIATGKRRASPCSAMHPREIRDGFLSRPGFSGFSRPGFSGPALLVRLLEPLELLVAALDRRIERLLGRLLAAPDGFELFVDDVADL